MLKRFRWILPIFTLLVPSLVFAEWAAYTSDNFTIYSDAREEDIVEAVENLEIFRRTALSILRLPDEPESERLLVVVYDRGRDFNRIGHSRTFAFFYHSVFGPRMIIGPRNSVEETQLMLFHEYVHHLMHRHSTVNFPIWYSEGFATMLSTAEIGESEIVLGKSPPGYLRGLTAGVGDASVHALVDIGNDDFSYPTAWLMTHYLVLGAGNGPRREMTLDYLRRFDAGEDPIDAFRKSFGMFPEEMDRELETYSRQRELPGLILPRAPYQIEVSRRVMQDGEDLYRLGDIAVERDALEAARDYFDLFEELAPDSPFQTNVMSRRAIAYVHERRVAEGDALIDDLLAQEVTDADVLADIAHYAYDRFVHERETAPEAGAMHLARSIDHGTRAVEANADDTEALYYLALAYEADGKLQLAVDTMLKSYDINPSVPRVNMNLVRMLIKGNQPEAASYLVTRLHSATHSTAARTELLELKQQIENGEIDLSTFDEP